MTKHTKASAKCKDRKVPRWVTRGVKYHLTMGILIMNSIFLGYMNSHNLHVNRSIVVAEGFAVACFVIGHAGSIVDDTEARNILLVLIREAFYIGSNIFIATVYKQAPRKCRGYADTPFGDVVPQCGFPSVRDSCGMQSAIFALSIIVA